MQIEVAMDLFLEKSSPINLKKEVTAMPIKITPKEPFI